MLVNSPKSQCMQKTFENFKRDQREDILKETMKKLIWFFPLHPVPTYGQDHEKQKRCGTSYHSPFELQNMFRKIPFLVWPFESGNCGKERKKLAKYSISQEQKKLFRGYKNYFP